MNNELKDLRKEIDEIDDELAALMEKRMAVVRKIAEKKKNAELPVNDNQREREIVDRLRSKSGELFFPYVSEFYRTVFDISKRSQREYLGRKEEEKL